jgi:hypothetical protein
MKKLGICGGLIGLALAMLAADSYAAAAGGKKIVHADTLTGYQESTPAAVSSPNGTGSFTATIDDTTISFELRYSGLGTPATVSHIHFGNRNTNGGVSVFLCGGGGRAACPAGTGGEVVVTGTITPNDVVGPAAQGIAAGEFDELIGAMFAGVTYANVHTTAFPNGEIRAQLHVRGDDD